jgi:hypothetical protein
MKSSTPALPYSDPVLRLSELSRQTLTNRDAPRRQRQLKLQQQNSRPGTAHYRKNVV